MTGRELRRIKVVESALAGRITNAEGARDLGLSVRQFIRIRARVAKEGPQGVIHRLRGRPSVRRLAEVLRQKVKDLLATKYAGFNDHHATEMLAEREGIHLSRETVRRLRREAGIGAVRRRRAPKHRRRRERRERQGDMILFDASDHDWLEGRGPSLVLLGAIDDATGEVISVRFEDREDVHGYFDLFEDVLAKKGVPASLYTDRHGVFHVNKPNLSVEEELCGEEELTQFGRAMAELGVVQIFSLSPQARGRIERLWATLQDRLASEMRLERIATKEEAGAFLLGFLLRHNKRFAIEPADAKSDFLPAPKDPGWFLCSKYLRTVGNDNTVRFHDRVIDIAPGPDRLTYAKAKVEVHELRTGAVRVIYQGRIIAQTASLEGFRLRCRRKRLLQLGDLPVATLPRRSRSKTSTEGAAVVGVG